MDLHELRARAAQLPDTSPHLAIVGRQLLQYQAYDDAIDVLRRAERLAPQSAELKFFATHALTGAGREDEIQQLREGFKPDTDQASTADLRKLLDLYISWHDEARAAAIAEKLLARPDRQVSDHAAYVTLLAQRRNGTRRAEKELRLFDTAWRSDPAYRGYAITARIHIFNNALAGDSALLDESLDLARAGRRANPRDAEAALDEIRVLARMRRVWRARLALWRLARQPTLTAPALVQLCHYADSLGSKSILRQAAHRGSVIADIEDGPRVGLAKLCWHHLLDKEAREILTAMDLGKSNNPTQLVRIASIARANNATDIATAATARLAEIMPAGRALPKPLTEGLEADTQADMFLTSLGAG